MIHTNDIKTALRACNELHFGETYVNRENFAAMQGFPAGHGRSGSAAPTASTGGTSTPRRTWPTSRTSRCTKSRGGKTPKSWPDDRRRGWPFDRGRPGRHGGEAT